MSVAAPLPKMEELIESIGDAGYRVSEIGASEGTAGNISVCLNWQLDPRRRFLNEEVITLPLAVPGLSGCTLLVTGSGRRLREIAVNPFANLGALVIEEGGTKARLFSSPKRMFRKLTSELNSHLAIHEDQFLRGGTNFSAVIHAQPLHITYLSHVPEYDNDQNISRRLLRWQPEGIINMPEGIGVVPFLLPGSPELMKATLESLRSHRLVVWSKHGVIARSEASVKRAADRIEYVESAAQFECLDLAHHRLAQGLTEAEIRRLADQAGIEQNVF